MEINSSSFKYFTFLLFQLIFSLIINAAQNEPFPAGYSMLNFGTIIQENSISGRQSWIPASFAEDTILFSLSSAYTNFYSAMDNLRDKDFHQVVLGFWININKIDVKGSGTLFNALGIYRENKGFLSAGTSIIPFLKFSLEFELYTIGLTRNNNESVNLSAGGLSLWIPLKFIPVSISLKNIYFTDESQPGLKQPFSISLGLHTISHRFGSQGVLITCKPKADGKINLYIGEELFIHPKVSINFAVSTKPLMISFGIYFTLNGNGFYSSFVHHPVLGWSQGLGMEYVKSHRGKKK
jgi:hypothetical protein